MKYIILPREEMKEEYYAIKCDCIISAMGSPCGQFIPLKFEDNNFPIELIYITQEEFEATISSWGYEL